jgi:hypothetical protein
MKIRQKRHSFTFQRSFSPNNRVLIILECGSLKKKTVLDGYVETTLILPFVLYSWGRQKLGDGDQTRDSQTCSQLFLSRSPSLSFETVVQNEGDAMKNFRLHSLVHCSPQTPGTGSSASCYVIGYTCVYCKVVLMFIVICNVLEVISRGCSSFLSRKLVLHLFRGVFAVKPAKLDTLVSRPPVTVGHTFMKLANS